MSDERRQIRKFVKPSGAVLYMPNYNHRSFTCLL